MSEEIHFVPANQSRCFLCQPTPERFVSHIRDGSWTLCSLHMQEVALIGDAEDQSGPVRAVEASPVREG